MARGAKLARRARRRSAARTAKRLPGRPRTPELPSFPFAPPRTTGPLWGRDEDGAKGLAVEVLCLPSPDWLKHRLTISGPEAELALFQAAAAGPGVIPWQSNVADLAEGWFNCMMAVPVPERGISVAGAHQLADRLRDAVESRLVAAFEHRRALACPLDLHALIPVPPALLGRGPVDPLAIAWLWAHWGTTWPLRHVTARPGPRPGREEQARLHIRFHAADWSPWPALRAIRARWPALRFTLRPDYGARPEPGFLLPQGGPDRTSPA